MGCVLVCVDQKDKKERNAVEREPSIFCIEHVSAEAINHAHIHTIRTMQDITNLDAHKSCMCQFQVVFPMNVMVFPSTCSSSFFRSHKCNLHNIWLEVEETSFFLPFLSAFIERSFLLISFHRLILSPCRSFNSFFFAICSFP